MCSLTGLADKIGGTISDIVVQTVVRHIGYIFRYKKNLKNLEDGKKNLEKQMRKNEGKVEVAKTEGEIVDNDVIEWMEMADNMRCEAEKFMDETTNNENMHCLGCSCSNFISRYRMSKQAKQRIGEVEGHTQKGNFDKVSHRAPPPPELQFALSSDFMNFDSRAPLLKMIKEAIADPTVNMIGVYGIGGVGKTTMVKEIGKQVKMERLCDEVVVAVVSKDANIREIQGQIADRLNLKLVAETKEGRAGELWNRLSNGKKNLVILDDVWQNLELTDIGIPLTDGKEDCKIILTTRKRDVLGDIPDDHKFRIEILPEQEAWDLFKKKVGKADESVELYSVAESVCKECQGLPVALLAVGASLKGKKKYAWDNALADLMNSSFQSIEGIHPKTYASLKLSYDDLGNEAKLCFSLCCLFPEDAEILIDTLVYHFKVRRLLDPDMNTMEKARGKVLTIVDTLKDRSLLLTGEENVVKMHDVVRDIAVSIAKIEKGYMVKHGIDKWPNYNIDENLTAIAIGLKNVNKAQDELVCPQLHTLLLECNNSLFELSDNFFSRVKELTILELKGIWMPAIPLPLTNMRNLRMLNLNVFGLKDIAILKCLKGSLEVLSLRSSYIKTLPSELGELHRLLVLDLGKCYQLEIIPANVITKLTDLEELYLPKRLKSWEELCGKSWAKEVDLSSLTRLTTLCIDIPDVKQFPNLCFGNLSIGVGEYNPKVPFFVTKTLTLSSVTLCDGMSSWLERAEALKLGKVKGLKKVLLDHEGKGFLDLKYLEMEGCDDMEYLLGRRNGFNKSNPFSKITILKVYNCSFKYLFCTPCSKRLQQLQELHIWSCENLESIVKTEGEKDEQDQLEDKVNFSKLKLLKLTSLPKLVSFFSEIEKNVIAVGVSSHHAQPLFCEKVTFPVLEELTIKDIPKIKEIWDKQLVPTVSFPQLARVAVIYCHNLVEIFPANMFKCAQNLKAFSARDCQGLEVIVSVIGEEESEAANNRTVIFPLLQMIELIALKKLKSFCDNSGRSEPQHLFDANVQFPASEVMKLSDLPNILHFQKQLSNGEVNFPRRRRYRSTSMGHQI